MNLNSTYTLIDGNKIPIIGFGTWQIEGSAAADAVTEAIRAGYVHIDTAAAYENEAEVGEGIRRSGIKRENIFITTKLWNAVRGYDETIAACEESMKKLGTDYIDLYLIHWPNPIKFRSCWKEKNAETWHAFEHLKRSGKVRSIGVSNFCPHHLDALFETAEIIPAVNQIRLCPGDTDDATVTYCKNKGILLEAYSPLARGMVFDSDAVTAISAKYGKTPSQLSIRWCLQNEFLPLPKSVSPAHMAENLQVFDFEIESADMVSLNALTGEYGTRSNPDDRPF